MDDDFSFRRQLFFLQFTLVSPNFMYGTGTVRYGTIVVTIVLEKREKQWEKMNYRMLDATYVPYVPYVQHRYIRNFVLFVHCYTVFEC